MDIKAKLKRINRIQSELAQEWEDIYDALVRTGQGGNNTQAAQKCTCEPHLAYGQHWETCAKQGRDDAPVCGLCAEKISAQIKKWNASHSQEGDEV